MKLRITVEGKAYDVEVEVLDGEPVSGRVSTPRAAASGPVSAVSSAPPPAANSAPAPAGAGDVQSPIAGSVMSIACKVGDAVAVGDTLLVLEAMKMESNVASPAAGTVREVCVAAGDAVQAGQVLVKIG